MIRNKRKEKKKNENVSRALVEGYKFSCHLIFFFFLFFCLEKDFPLDEKLNSCFSFYIIFCLTEKKNSSFFFLTLS